MSKYDDFDLDLTNTKSGTRPIPETYNTCKEDSCGGTCYSCGCPEPPERPTRVYTICVCPD